MSEPIKHEVCLWPRDRNYYRHVWTQGGAAYEWVSKLLDPPAWARDEAYRMLDAFNYITPRKRDKKVEHKTLSKLDEVKDYTLKLERQLAAAQNKLAENAMRRTPDRALYVNLDGSMKVEEAKMETRPDKQDPAYEIHFETRHFRRAFSQGTLHVYQEIG